MPRNSTTAPQNHSGSSIERRTRASNSRIPCAPMNRPTFVVARASAGGVHTTSAVTRVTLKVVRAPHDGRVGALGAGEIVVRRLGPGAGCGDRSTAYVLVEPPAHAELVLLVPVEDLGRRPCRRVGHRVELAYRRDAGECV